MAVSSPPPTISSQHSRKFSPCADISRKSPQCSPSERASDHGSGFDVRKTAVNLPEGNETTPRKPSVTNLGVLPLPGIPADLATTIEDVHQSSYLLRVTFEDVKGLGSKQIGEGIRKLSRALSFKNVSEVIREDTRSPGSPDSSSKASSNPEGRDEVTNSSSVEWLLGQSSSTNQGGSSPHPIPLDGQGRKASEDGDNSPTSRVFQWIFKDQTEDMISISEKSPKQPHSLIPEGEPPILSGEGEPYPSITLARPDVVSFPPLPSRQSTSDWISPLPDMSAPSSGDGKCFYRADADARVGDTSNDVNISLLNVSGNTAPKAETERRQELPVSDAGSNTRQGSSTLLQPQVSSCLGDQFKIGKATGSSSGARRKSSSHSVRLRIDNEALEPHYHEGQTSWTKPRKHSWWPFPKSPSSKELASRKISGTPTPPSVAERDKATRDKGSEAERLTLIKSIEPLLSGPDHAGIYGVLTGTEKDGADCGTCCTEHMRGDTLDPRKSSSDWRG